MAIVVIGGLITSTLMDQIVTPAAFKLFGAYVYRPPEGGGNGTPTIGWDDAWMHEVSERPIDRIEPTPQKAIPPE